MRFAQAVVDSLSLGGSYALLGVGFAIVYSVANLVNWAHGALITIGAYMMLLLTNAGVGFGWVIPGVLVTGAVAAVLMERIAFRPVRGAHPMTMLITSYALAEIIQLALQVFVSPQTLGVRLPGLLSKTVHVWGLRVGVPELMSYGATGILLAGLAVFLRATRTGLAMQAAAEDFTTTRLMGVRANRVIATAFALSGTVAGMSAVLLVADGGTVSPNMGTAPVIVAFIAAAIGGFGSLVGAGMAGLAYAVIQTFMQSYLPAGVAGYQDAFVWVCLLGVLMWRPRGLLGRQYVRA